MFNNTGAMVPMVADIGCNGGNRNGGMFGNNDDLLGLIILFAVFGGWGFGNNGNRNCNGGSSGETTTIIMPPMGGYGMNNTNFGFSEAAVQRGFDNQTVINKLDGINNGLCSLGYDQLAQMNGINTNIMQTGFGLQQAINNNTVSGMQNTNSLQNQISSCCCDGRSAIKDLQFAMATQNCDLRSEVHQTGDAIINSQNWGFRNLEDKIDACCDRLERQAEQRYIRELEGKLNACDRDRALQDTANYIIGVTNPRAVPAYPSCNPNSYGNWSPNILTGNGYNNCGCGCGNGLTA